VRGAAAAVAEVARPSIAVTDRPAAAATATALLSFVADTGQLPSRLTVTDSVPALPTRSPPTTCR
jgi:hypothetical protein